MSEHYQHLTLRSKDVFVATCMARGQGVVCGDCIAVMKHVPSSIVDVIVTSPPYNRRVRYGAYDDDRPKHEYLEWCAAWMVELRRILKEDGSLFLNVGASPRQPDGPRELLKVARQIGFALQNEIAWVKAIYVPGAVRIKDVRKRLANPKQAVDPRLVALLKQDGHAFGHFRPITSRRFLTPVHETVFHLTSGDTKLDRLAIGVPYADPSNKTRWKSRRPRRCPGNAWFIPYETKTAAALHPASFPVELPRKCIRLHFGETRKGLVLDPFGGTGTTALAARNDGHRAISIELDPQYHNIAAARLRDAGYGRKPIPA